MVNKDNFKISKNSPKWTNKMTHQNIHQWVINYLPLTDNSKIKSLPTYHNRCKSTKILLKIPFPTTQIKKILIIKRKLNKKQPLIWSNWLLLKETLIKTKMTALTLADSMLTKSTNMSKILYRNKPILLKNNLLNGHKRHLSCLQLLQLTYHLY